MKKRITLDELQDYTMVSVSDEKQIAALLGLEKDDDVIKAMTEFILSVSQEGYCPICEGAI